MHAHELALDVSAFQHTVFELFRTNVGRCLPGVQEVLEPLHRSEPLRDLTERHVRQLVRGHVVEIRLARDRGTRFERLRSAAVPSRCRALFCCGGGGGGAERAKHCVRVDAPFRVPGVRRGRVCIDALVGQQGAR